MTTRRVGRFFVAAWAALGLALIWASLCWAREAVVVTSDGRRLTGEVVSEDEQGVTLQIAGIPLRIDRSHIKELQYQPTVEEQYRQRLSELAEDDVQGRYELATWLVFQKEAYELAVRELGEMIARYPQDGRFVRLREIAASRAERQRSEGEGAAPSTVPDSATAPLPGPGQTTPSGSERRRLTAAQINVIKVFELPGNLLEAKPPVTIPRAVVDQFLKTYANRRADLQGPANQANFRNLKGYQQLDIFFQLRAREFYPQVQVRGDPPALSRFRNEIHQRYVLGYCGTSECHGGGDGHGLALLASARNDDATVYTNFFLLQITSVGGRELVHRDDPQRSLLLQYGLLVAKTPTPHPNAPGWKPYFTDPSDRYFQQITEWIGSLYRPKPDYGIVQEAVEPEAPAGPGAGGAGGPAGPAK